MNRFFTIALSASLLFGFAAGQSGATPPPRPTSLPRYAHVVIVIEENKYYSDIIGSRDAPYLNKVLLRQGADLTRMFSEEHDSEGNYFWIFSGSNQHVGYRDVIPTRRNNPDYPFTDANLGEELIRAGYTFKGYAESLPSIGDRVGRAQAYARKHVPWISFANIPNGKTEATSVNLPFRKFPKHFSRLPTVSIVIPNLYDDMHSGVPWRRVKQGDNWLKRNIGPYYQWARTHDSLLIVTWDENEDRSGFHGLTDPASSNRSIRNRIPTVIAGAHIRHGNYSEGRGVTQVNVLRTVEAIYGLPKAGRQQKYARHYGITNDYVIRDIFAN
ncbi:MAG: acid phosphatase [Gammaproteobacteria bacterium]|nr:acid phosphatase [Gammaproteobacteria bacterium]